MSHPLAKIWIHLIFRTKNRLPLIKPTFEQKLFDHITNLLEKDFNCKVVCINGMPDHIHILFLQNQNYSISEIVKKIKGNSSHWINQEGFYSNKFMWQTGYGAFSISESMPGNIKKYISNQKEHHKKVGLAEEYKKFEEKFGFTNLNRRIG